MRSTLLIPLLLILLTGCSSDGKPGLLSGLFGGGGAPEVSQSSDPTVQATANALWPLTAVGGLMILVGAVMLFVTKLGRGWIPMLVGIGLVVLNAAVLRFLDSTAFWIATGVAALVALWMVVHNGLWLKNGKKGKPTWLRRILSRSSSAQPPGSSSSSSPPSPFSSPGTSPHHRG